MITIAIGERLAKKARDYWSRICPIYKQSTFRIGHSRFLLILMLLCSLCNVIYVRSKRGDLVRPALWCIAFALSNQIWCWIIPRVEIRKFVRIYRNTVCLYQLVFFLFASTVTNDLRNFLIFSFTSFSTSFTLSTSLLPKHSHLIIKLPPTSKELSYVFFAVHEAIKT